MQWLEEECPLSAPYFLGQALFDDLNDPHAPARRGQSLRNALLAAADTLWSDGRPADKDTLVTAAFEDRQTYGYRGGSYLHFLLELRYFRRFFRPLEHPQPTNEIALSDYLGISRATFFNHLKVAQQQLGEALLRTVRPTFRLEQPPRLPPRLVGREGLVQEALSNLRKGKSVALSGASGVGKTAVGSAISQQWLAQHVFWFTLRPSFNDQLSSLLFSLGYFLHRQGASGLWQQLIADKGKIEDFNLALGHIRGDQKALSNRKALSDPVLICIDELEVLQSEPDQTTTTQAQLISFLESLHNIFPTLFMGQKPVILADAHFEITNLSLPEAADFLNGADSRLLAGEQEQFHAYTDGNPRLLQLCLALYETGAPFESIVNKVPQTPTLQALWGRLWQRFSADERQILSCLSVYRSPAPEDVWASHGSSLEQLMRWRIVLADGVGGLSLLPTIRDLVYADRQRFPVENRELCHFDAAHVRASRGEYTPAAYHFFQAGEASQMVQVWFPQRQLEIERGQGSAALALFEQVSARTLSKKEQEALALVRAELYALTGEADQGLAAVNSIRWPPVGEMTVQARLLQGDFLYALGQPYRAIKRYDEGVAVITRLLNQLTHYRYQKSILFVQQREMTAASREANLAQYEAVYLQGIIHEENGRFQEARQQYTQALELAKLNNYDQGLARTHRAISKIYGRLADIESAQRHAEEAILYYRRIGDRLTEETVRTSLAASYFQAGDYQQAISAAESAVSFFADAQNPFWEAVTASTLAEAYYEVGDFAKATQTAQRVLFLEETYTQPYAHFTLGLVAKAQNELDEAEKQFRASQQIANNNEDHYLAAYAWRGLGETLLAMNKLEAGKAAVSQSIALFEKLGLTQEIERTVKLINEFKETLG
ncbi:MAG: tetratricopeptide repeat protein [Candidatus Promineifilaceae bacterium]